jgi:hypothetical protein
MARVFWAAFFPKGEMGKTFSQYTISIVTSEEEIVKRIPGAPAMTRVKS